MPFLLGLTGNIACGKSTVGRWLEAWYGAQYVDADRQVHLLYTPGSEVTNAVAARFGVDLLMADGNVDRRRLGDLVMADPVARRDLESIVSPVVMRAILQVIDESTADVVVLDAIRLFEAELSRRCQDIWVVRCPRELQIQRLVATRGFTAEQAALRVDAQAPQEEKVRRAGYVLDNSGDVPALERQVRRGWAERVAPLFAR